jgi:hypothetical protein
VAWAEAMSIRKHFASATGSHDFPIVFFDVDLPAVRKVKTKGRELENIVES